MKKIALLMAFVLLLFTACSSEQISEESKPDLEELAENVYVDYDRTKYENVSAPPVYYAEYAKPNDSTLASFFSSPPKIYDDDKKYYRKFENEHEHGCYSLSHGTVHYRTNDGMDFYTVSRICLIDNMSSVKDLDFMSLEELYKKFDEDVRKFIDNYEIFEITAVTADIFEEITTHYEDPAGERVFCEPEDCYFIHARQFVNEIPIFTGAYTPNPNAVPRMYHAGAKIEACYTKNGLEVLYITGYRVIEEKTADGEFVDLKGAEQIIRDYYTMPYGPIYERLYDCALVYVGVFEGEKTVLTPAWEFYCDYYGYELGERPWEDLGSPAIRINAYTGDLMWES